MLRILRNVLFLFLLTLQFAMATTLSFSSDEDDADLAKLPAALMKEFVKLKVKLTPLAGAKSIHQLKVRELKCKFTKSKDSIDPASSSCSFVDGKDGNRLQSKDITNLIEVLEELSELDEASGLLKCDRKKPQGCNIEANFLICNAQGESKNCILSFGD